MLFLKKFKAVGFKSFANPISIDFTESMIGVVGPNGSGKSNIVDAIKWVLGERSNKVLRAKDAIDTIFSGSEDKKPSEFASVTLVFDNSSKILHSDEKEIAITRKLSRKDAQNEYFINDKPCRLKDVHEMFLDTGLTKGSLGIISQGTIQWFVTAAPEERRKIFEDAAGIGLYSKKKTDALSELNRANENVNQVSTYANALKKDIVKLSKQVEKAEVYNQKKKQLMDLELVVLAKDITASSSKIRNLKTVIENAVKIIKDNELELETSKKEIALANEKVNQSDAIIDEYQKEFNDLVVIINKLDIKANSLKDNLESNLSSSNLQKKQEAYKSIISTYKFDLDNANMNYQKLNEEIQSYTSIKDDTQNKLDSLNNNIAILGDEIHQVSYKLRYIDDHMNNEFAGEKGIQTVFDNKNIFGGVIGLVKDSFTVDKQYEKAILIGLNKALNYLIVESDQDAKVIIDFLKKNKAGKVSFAPLNLIKSRYIRDEHKTIVDNIDGFIDMANNLIQCEDKFNDLFGMLLGRTIIAKDYQSAINIANYINRAYPIITLDGESITVGGIVTGGYDQRISTYNLKEQKEELTSHLTELNKSYANARTECVQIKQNLSEIEQKINEKKIIVSSYQNRIENLQNNLMRYQTEYEQIKGVKVKDTSSTNVDDIFKEVASANAKKDKIVQQLNVARTTKLNCKQRYDDLLHKSEEIRNLVDKARGDESDAQIELAKLEATIKQAREKIALDYKMTVDHVLATYNKELPMSDAQARELIYQLHIDLDRIGNINMEALDEYEAKKKEFEDIDKQLKELTEAKNKIVLSINELDAKAKASFTKTIDSVNESLPSVFKYLFGGGTCSVQYDNPSDILNSGIEVVVAPPGKKITNLNLLSGGEKSLVALVVLFGILKVHAFPLVIFDEAESALDPSNVERFSKIIHNNSKDTQFIIITHRPGTMERCDSLYGATMQIKGITSLYKVTLDHARTEFGDDNI